MIDINGRNRIYDMRTQGNMVKGIFTAVEDAVKLKKENKELMESVSSSNEKVAVLLDKILRSIALLYRATSTRKEPEIKLPRAVDIDNFDELEHYFKMLNDRIGALATAISQIPQTKIELPKGKDTKFDPKMTEFLKEIAEGIKNVKQPKVEFPSSVEVSNWPVQMTPQPVTNININPLRGIVHTTAVTVTTSLTPLPSYGVLDNRRSMIIFNNDSTNAIYIGGSDVTTANGLPVLAQSYSPAVDSGPLQKWYGVATTSVNVRVCEVQNDSGA